MTALELFAKVHTANGKVNEQTVKMTKLQSSVNYIKEMVLEFTTKSKVAVNEDNPVKNKFAAGTVSDQILIKILRNEDFSY
jgi:ribonuclease I